MAFTPTAVSKSSNFVATIGGDTTAEVLSDLLDNRAEIYSVATEIAKQFYGATPPSSPDIGTPWRCSTTGGGYTADALYRWNGAAWVADTVDTLNVPDRQMVLAGPVDGSGNAKLFTTSASSLNVQLNANVNAPVVVSFMNGWNGFGAADSILHITDTTASFWTAITQNQTSYLYIENNSGTPVGGASVIAPVNTNVAPAHTAGLHWINDTTGLVKVSDGSAWTTVSRVFVGSVTTDSLGVTAYEIYPYSISRIKLQGGFTLPIVPDSSLCSATVVMPYGMIVQQIDINCRTQANATQTPSESTDAVLYVDGSSFDTRSFTTADTAITGLLLALSQGEKVDVRLSAQNGLTGFVNVTYRGVRT